MFARLRQLFTNLTIYGLGDVATSLVSFLLLPLYVRYLSPSDYGVIGLLLTVEIAAKIIFRWGIDASFMRLYYDCPDHPARQRLASTIFFFLAATNGVLLAAALALSPLLARHLFGDTTYVLPLQLVLVNTFVVGFYFIPFHVLRIQGRSPQFIGLTVSRSVATLVMRLVLVIAAGLGVLGLVLADLIVTALFTIALARSFAPLIRPVFSRALLAEALRFGLPRLPHGIALQTVAAADRYLLSLFVTLAEIGVYSIGATFGLAMKLFLSAFEYAWAPFYFAIMKERDAKRTYSTVTTYGLAVLALLTAALSALAPDLVRLMTTPAFFGAAAVVPWIAVGVLLQGVYLLTSIGLNITKHTEYYPVATGLAAATSVGANLILIPRSGALGAAWSNALAYGVLAVTAMWFSQRVYPIAYEWARIGRIAVAAAGAFVAARLVWPAAADPLPGLLVRGVAAVAVFPAILLATGFFQPREMRRIKSLAATLRTGRRTDAPAETAELAGEIVDASVPEPMADQIAGK